MQLNEPLRRIPHTTHSRMRNASVSMGGARSVEAAAFDSMDGCAVGVKSVEGPASVSTSGSTVYARIVEGPASVNTRRVMSPRRV